MDNQYTKSDCIESLKEAADKLGKSPTSIEYREMDIYPTYSVFYDKFGSWNEAKEAANLDTYMGRELIEPPEKFNISMKRWKSLNAKQRKRIRSKFSMDEYKVNKGCAECGYDEHPFALSFHHINKESKEFDISQVISRNNKSIEDVEEEAKKCEVICENCHREKQSRDSLYNELLLDSSLVTSNAE